MATCVDCTLTAGVNGLGRSSDDHLFSGTAYGELVSNPRVIGAETQVTNFQTVEYTNPYDCRSMLVMVLCEGSVHVLLGETYIDVNIRQTVTGALVSSVDTKVAGYDSRLITTGNVRYGGHWVVPKHYTIPPGGTVTFGTHLFCRRLDGTSAQAEDGGSRVTFIAMGG